MLLPVLAGDIDVAAPHPKVLDFKKRRRHVPTPEEAFDECVKQCPKGEMNDGLFVPLFNGRQDIDGVEEEDLRSLLVGIKANMNRWLADRKQVDHHIDDLPFHFDYIDSKVSTAVAFRGNSYAFIGMTVKFVEDLRQTSRDLSRAKGVRQIFNFDDGREDGLELVFFDNLLNLTIAHEFTHHVHGHVLRQDGIAKFFIEFDGSEPEEGLLRQAEESDADGYGAYHVLANAIDGSMRISTARAIGLQNMPEAHLDEVIYLIFLVAICAQFTIRGLLDIRDGNGGFINVWAKSHPPQAARLDCLMRHAVLWCEANRPALAVFTTQRRFREIMSTVAEAMWGPESHKPWDEQAAFLRTEKGIEYMKALTSVIDAQKKELGKNSSKASGAAGSY